MYGIPHTLVNIYTHVHKGYKGGEKNLIETAFKQCALKTSIKHWKTVQNSRCHTEGEYIIFIYKQVKSIFLFKTTRYLFKKTTEIS